MAHKHSPKLCLTMGFLNLLWKIVFNKIQIVDVKIKVRIKQGNLNPIYFTGGLTLGLTL